MEGGLAQALQVSAPLIPVTSLHLGRVHPAPLLFPVFLDQEGGRCLRGLFLSEVGTRKCAECQTGCHELRLKGAGGAKLEEVLGDREVPGVWPCSWPWNAEGEISVRQHTPYLPEAGHVPGCGGRVLASRAQENPFPCWASVSFCGHWYSQ